MPSPFPGMNPWIERGAIWQDFHDSFLPAAREALNAQIAPRYLARIQEHLYVDDFDGETHRIGVSDVSVSRSRTTETEEPAAAVQTLIAPARVWQVETEVTRQISIEIRDRQHRRLVAVIELLSPANKRQGRVRDQYLLKREQYLESDAHFVEVDLLRGGPRMPWRELPRCDYYALISRAKNRPEAEIWPIRLRERLPEIPIPLNSGDPDARLDLQAILDRVYDAAAYAVDIYSGDPEPPLSADDAAWAASILAAVPK